jgi:hypothetical protein
MTDQIKSQLEIAAENLSIEFQRVLINEMSTEDGLVPVLMDIGSDPARYINIFSDEIIRLGAAYYKTITAWTELDEMGIDDYIQRRILTFNPILSTSSRIVRMYFLFRSRFKLTHTSSQTEIAMTEVNTRFSVLFLTSL